MNKCSLFSLLLNHLSIYYGTLRNNDELDYLENELTIYRWELGI